MNHRHDPLRHEQWVPLVDDDEQSKPFDQTNGATATVAESAPSEFDEATFLLEKGVAGNVAAGMGGGLT